LVKKIEYNTVKKILSLLDIEIIHDDGVNLSLMIPSYRIDVKQEADVIEEILRIYGYKQC